MLGTIALLVGATMSVAAIVFLVRDSHPTPRFAETGGLVLVYQIPAAYKPTPALINRIIRALKARFERNKTRGVEFAAEGPRLTIRVPVPDSGDREALRKLWKRNPRQFSRELGDMEGLAFRLAPRQGEIPDLKPYVQQLDQGVQHCTGAYCWFPIHSVHDFAHNEDALRRLQSNPQAYFRAFSAAIARRKNGRIYLLLDNRVGKSVVPGRDACTLEHVAKQDRDGRRTVSLTLDAAGGKLMRRLTRANVGRFMAIVAGGEVFFTAMIRSPVERNISISTGDRPGEPETLYRVLDHFAPVPLKLVSLRYVSKRPEADQPHQ
ncbi:MAG: hypothetical protein P8076_04605 [Gammaproteobacteria bacterium]